MMIGDKKQTVLVTGASSSLGKSVVEALSLRRHNVISTQHSEAGRELYFDLSTPTDNSLPGFRIDSVVAIAWNMRDRDPGKQTENVEGTLFLLNFAKQNQANFVFVSTTSAESGWSEYGKAKLQVEKAVVQYQRGFTIRAGLLIGKNPTPIQTAVANLGRFPGLCFHLQPDQIFDVTKVEQMAAAIAVTCEEGRTVRPKSEAMPLSDVVHLLAKPRLKFHVTVPWQIPYHLLRITDNFSYLKLPKSDSLLVLTQTNRCRHV